MKEAIDNLLLLYTGGIILAVVQKFIWPTMTVFEFDFVWGSFFVFFFIGLLALFVGAILLRILGELK